MVQSLGSGFTGATTIKTSKDTAQFQRYLWEPHLTRLYAVDCDRNVYVLMTSGEWNRTTSDMLKMSSINPWSSAVQLRDVLSYFISGESSYADRIAVPWLNRVLTEEVALLILSDPTPAGVDGRGGEET